jgi:hypothetical protein
MARERFTIRLPAGILGGFFLRADGTKPSILDHPCCPKIGEIYEVQGQRYEITEKHVEIEGATAWAVCTAILIHAA